MITHGHCSSLYKSRRRSKKYPKVHTKAPKSTSIKNKASDRTVSPQTGIYASKYWTASPTFRETQKAIRERKEMLADHKQQCINYQAARTAVKERKRYEAAKR